MPRTRTGLLVPAGTAANDVPGDLGRLADRIEAQDRTPFTTLTRDALAGDELWVGRRIWNVTVGEHQVCTAIDATASPQGTWRDTSQAALDAAAAAQGRADGHAARHATGQPDQLTAAQVGALTQTGADDRYVPLTQRAAPNGVATLDAAGRLPSAQVPPIAVTDTFVVASQTAMLALTAQVGDLAVRTDQNRTYALRVGPATTLANWQELRTPTDSVLSVNAQTGAVALGAADVGAAAAEHDSVHDVRFVRLAGGALTGPLTLAAGGQIRPDYTPASAAVAPDQYPLGVSEGTLLGGDWPVGAGTHLTVRYSAIRGLQIVVNAHNAATNRTEVHVRYGYDALWGPWNSLTGLSNEDFATATALAPAYPYGTTVFGVSSGAAGWPVAGTAAVQTIRTGGVGYGNSCAVQHFWPRASPSRAWTRSGTETAWNAWAQL